MPPVSVPPGFLNRPITPESPRTLPEQAAPRAINNPSNAHRAYGAALIKAHEAVSLQVKDNPQTLLYRAALEAINESLAEEFGDDAIGQAAQSGEDFSPEAVADRIVQFATGFFSQYQKNHAEDSLETQLDDFITLMTDAVDSGFGEARDILKGLQVLEGKVADDIDTTFDKVLEGFEAFREQLLQTKQDTDHTTASHP